MTNKQATLITSTGIGAMLIIAGLPASATFAISIFSLAWLIRLNGEEKKWSVYLYLLFYLYI